MSTRIALTDDSGRWFDWTKAQGYAEQTSWNGQNNVSRVTRSQWEHERLYRTAGGRWILNHWSQWQGVMETYEEINDRDASAWFARNDTDPPAEAAEAFAELEM